MFKNLKRKVFDIKRSFHFWINYELPKYSKVIPFVILTVIFSVILFFLDKRDSNFSWHDLLVELHGLLFDIIIFGFILTLFEYFRLRKENINNLENEISDLIELKNDYARVKIISNINKLYSLGIRRFILSGAYLNSGNLHEFDFTNSMMVLIEFEYGSFVRSNLTNVDLRYSILKNVYFTDAYLKKTNLEGANCQGSFFTCTNFESANLEKADLRKSIFIGCEYKNSNFHNVKLTNTKVDILNWFDELHSQNVKGVEDLKKIYFVDPDSRNDKESVPTYLIKKKNLNR